VLHQLPTVRDVAGITLVVLGVALHQETPHQETPHQETPHRETPDHRSNERT